MLSDLATSKRVIVTITTILAVMCRWIVIHYTLPVHREHVFKIVRDHSLQNFYSVLRESWCLVKAFILLLKFSCKIRVNLPVGEAVVAVAVKGPFLVRSEIE